MGQSVKTFAAKMTDMSEYFTSACLKANVAHESTVAYNESIVLLLWFSPEVLCGKYLHVIDNTN